MLKIFYLNSILLTTNNDVPEPWGLFFQDNATSQMEGLEELHNNIMFYLAIILFAVSWIMLSVIIKYKAKISNKYVNHGTLVELIWTITPALILVFSLFSSTQVENSEAISSIFNSSEIPETTWIDVRLIKFYDKYYLVDNREQTGENLLNIWPLEDPELTKLRYNGTTWYGVKLDIDPSLKKETLIYQHQKYYGHYYNINFGTGVTSYNIPIQKNSYGLSFFINKKVGNYKS